MTPEVRQDFEATIKKISEGCIEAVKLSEDVKTRSRLRLVPLYILIIKPVLREVWDAGRRYEAHK